MKRSRGTAEANLTPLADGRLPVGAFIACILAEADFDLINPAIHTANDDISRVNFNHINEWLKLGLGYLVETSYE